MLKPSRVRAPRSRRVERIGRKLAAHRERQKAKDAIAWGGKPLRRREFRLKQHRLFAYDLETTRIKAGETPEPKYLTAYGDDWQASCRVQSIEHLGELIEARMLIPEFNRAQFVAWNGNNFDVYLVARALINIPGYVVKPYLTRGKQLRGVKVFRIEKWRDTEKGRDVELSWEFLDGLAMTGLSTVKMPLKDFLAQFAPDFGKLAGPDFEHGEEFDANNAEHVRYAERDSEGLYHAMKKFESIVAETFGLGLAPTIGKTAIKAFQASMPERAECWRPALECLLAIRNSAMRGGYCFRARKFDGPIWKYDLNQAYAAAMRDAKLPSGRCFWNPPSRGTGAALNPYATVFIARVRGRHPKNKIPFLVVDLKGAAVFATSVIPECWITSIEYNQLKNEGAKLEVLESFFWDEHFNMKGYVDRLEELRMNAEGGPSGPLGTIAKLFGNASYGKTLERLDGIDLVMANECPEGFSAYQGPEEDSCDRVWFRFIEPRAAEYHQPQIGAFITAHVRMVMRRAIRTAPEAWLYADTDCLAFDRPVELPIDSKRYGFWKIEEEGKPHLIIEKKVYAAKLPDAKGKLKIHAKGLNVKRLTLDDMQKWFEGRAPEQTQVQRVNFVSFVTGDAMFRAQDKTGQRKNPSPEIRL